MSKVIFKIGPETPLVNKEDIIEISYGITPKTKIKFAKNRSVIFFERNPFYITITDSGVENICELLETAMAHEAKAEQATEQEDSDYHTRQYQKVLAMASINIESMIAGYISRNLFDDFSVSLVKALKNAKKVAYRAADRKNQDE